MMKIQWPDTTFFVQNFAAYLESFDAETQSWRGAQSLPPLHVPGFQHRLLGSFLGCWDLWVHSHHLLVHVMTRLGPLSGHQQLLLEVRAVKESIVTGAYILH